MNGRRERGCGEHRRLGLESFIWAVRPELTKGGFEGSSLARSGAQRAWGLWCHRLCNYGVTGEPSVNKQTRAPCGPAANTSCGLGFRLYG